MTNRRVLLVDDVRDEREMYAQWFRQKGYCTLQAGTPDDAYRLAVELTPDLAIVDLGLPSMEDGLSLARRLKGDHATRRLPLIVLTGHVMEATRHAAAHAGCDAFISKPCEPDALANAIRQFLPPVEVKR